MTTFPVLRSHVEYVFMTRSVRQNILFSDGKEKFCDQVTIALCSCFLTDNIVEIFPSCDQLMNVM